MNNGLLADFLDNPQIPPILKLKIDFSGNASRDKLKDHLKICLVSKDELLTRPGSKVMMV